MTAPRRPGAFDHYETPWPIVRDAEFKFNVKFNLDPCAEGASVAKAPAYITPAGDGLKQNWADWAKPLTVFVNPPYGRALKHWVKKCADEAENGAHVVALIPPAMATGWWYEHVVQRANRVIVYVGRISFLLDGKPTGKKWVDSCLVEWKPRRDEDGVWVEWRQLSLLKEAK